MPYVLYRQEDGKYVTPEGSAKSYTPKLEDARRYPTREIAERHACGNERMMQVS